MEKIGILGAGSWGTALALLLQKNGHEVTVWSISKEEVDMLNMHREHKDKLPGIEISKEIQFTSNLEEAICDKNIIVFAVPSPFTRDTANSVKKFIQSNQVIVNVSKGIEEKTMMTLSEVIEDEIKDVEVAVLSGPSHAEEVGRGIPTTCVVGAHSKHIADRIQDAFMGPTFRVYTSPDVTGIELGAALKNVIALAAGISDGLGFGDNTKAALMTRGISEITRLGVAMGGSIHTFSGLSGIGDLIVTCTSMHSRNRRAGILIGKGCSLKEAQEEVKMVVEGVFSAKAALSLGQKYDVSMPIIEQVNHVLFDNKNAKEAVMELMERSKVPEHKDFDWNKAPQWERE